MTTVLLVSPDTRLTRRFDREFGSAGVPIRSVSTLELALVRLAHGNHHVVIVDESLLGPAPRLTINQLRASSPDAQVVVLSPLARIPSFADCVRDNLVTILPKPVRQLGRFIDRLAGVPCNPLLDREPIVGLTGIASAHGILHASAVMSRALDQALVAASTSDPVLLLGETGTGKALFARLIHNVSARQPSRFVAVNCASLSNEIADSELFGRTKGAFTGATDRRGGLFHHAAGGTLFLDEIGELNPKVQAKLLRVLEDGEVRRVGSAMTDRVDVRIVAASNRNLWSAAEAGEFRPDLYHRIAGHRIQLPPLRDRRQDIALLAAHFLAELEPVRLSSGFTRDAMDVLTGHPWPGNVRALRQAVRGAAATARGRSITATDLRAILQQEKPDHTPSSVPVLSLRSFERKAIHRALQASQGNASAAARLLGIGRATFYRKLAAWDAVG